MVQLTDKQKYTIIVLREENYTINDIAEKIGVNRNTVIRWDQQYKKDQTITRRKGSGRKKMTSPEGDNMIIDIIKTDNDLSANDIKTILEDQDIDISVATVQRRLAGNGFLYKFPISKPLLTDDQKKKG